MSWNTEIVSNNYIRFEDSGDTYLIPGTPDDLSDQHSASWSTTNILGRGSPIYVYQGGGDRQLSINFDLHRDMELELGYNIDELLNVLKAACYPVVQNSYIIPPVIAIRFFDIYFDNCVMTGCSFSWKLPIVDGHYQCCSVSLSISSAPLNPYISSYFKVSNFLSDGTRP